MINSQTFEELSCWNSAKLYLLQELGENGKKYKS